MSGRTASLVLSTAMLFVFVVFYQNCGGFDPGAATQSGSVFSSSDPGEPTPRPTSAPRPSPQLAIFPITMQVMESRWVRVEASHIDQDYSISWRLEGAPNDEFEKIAGEVVIPKGAVSAFFQLRSMGPPGIGTRHFNLKLTESSGVLQPLMVSVTVEDPTPPWAISVKGNSTCALMMDRAKCWGLNAAGQLGTGDKNNQNRPMLIANLPSGTLTDLQIGGTHACALISGGLYCWGANTNGQLGDGTTTERLRPTAVSSMTSGVSAFSLGEQHTCAIKSGAVYCWGLNSSGQLGSGDLLAKTLPTAILSLASGVTKMSLSVNSSCAIQNGALKCWGANASGQLGDNTKINRNSPVAVTGAGAGVSDVSMGRDHTCVVISDAVRCWGLNSSSQLGDGTTTQRLTMPSSALQIGGGKVRQVVAGEKHSCALVMDGVHCWGSNDAGQMGTKFRTSSAVPVPAVGLETNVLRLAGGGASSHNCAAIYVPGSGPRLTCWGRNLNGQVGIGTNTNVLEVPAPFVP